MSSELPVEIEPENTPPSGGKPKKAGRWAWFPRVGLFLLVSIVATQIVFYFYADVIIGRVLKEVVSLKSEELYSLEYDEIHFNFFASELDITQLRLIPNREKYYNYKTEKWRTKNNIFELQIPTVKLYGASLLDFYWNKSLDIEVFETNGPEIKVFIPLKDDIEVNKKLKIRDLSFLIADKMDFLAIRSLNILDASLDVSVSQENGEKENYQLQNLSLRAINFLIDSAQNRQDDRPFTVEDISITSQYNYLPLPNSPYALHIEDLSVSTYAGSCEIAGLGIVCQEDAKNGKGKFGNKNNFELYVSKFRADGIDYRRAYFDKYLKINQISLNKPEFTFYGIGTKTKDPEKKARELYKKFSKQFKTLEISKILLNKAYLQVNKRNKELFYLSNINGELERFLLDSTNHIERSKFFFLDNVELSMQDYEALLADNLHKINVKDFSISTKKQLLEAQQVSINCIKTKTEIVEIDTLGKIKALYADFPLLRCVNFDIKKAYIDRDFKIDQALVYQPAIKIFTHWADSLSNERPDSLVRIKDLYPFTQSFANSIQIGVFNLKDANIEMIRAYGDEKATLKIDTASLRLYNVSIDKNSKYKENTFLNTRQIEVKLANFSFIRPDSLYQIRLGRLKASQKDSSIVLQNFELRPLIDSVDFSRQTKPLPPNFIKVKWKEIKLDSIDVTKAYYSGVVDVKKVAITQPEIKLFKHPFRDYSEVDFTPHQSISDFISKNFEKLSLQEIELKKGTFSIVDDHLFNSDRLRIDSIRAFTNNLLIDSNTLAIPNTLFILDTFLVYGKQLTFFLPDSNHVLKTGNLGVSTAIQEAFVEQISIGPLAKLKGKSLQRYNGQLPNLRLKGFDPKLLYYDKILDADTLWLPNFQIDMQLQAGSKNTIELGYQPGVSLENLYEQIVRPLRSIEVRQTISEGGKFNLKQLANDGTFRGAFSGEEVSIQIPNLIIDSTQKVSAKRFFYADDAIFKIENFYQFLPDSSYTFHFGEVGFSAQRGNFYGKELNIHPIGSFIDKDYIGVYMPSFEIDSIDLYQYYKQKKLFIGSVVLDAPWLKASLFPKAKKNVFSVENLPSQIKPFAQSVVIKKFKVNEADLNINHFQSLKPERYQLGKLSIWADSIEISEQALNNSNKLFFANTIEASLKNYHLKLPDSLNSLYLKEMRVNTTQKSILFDSLLFTPLYPKYEYAKRFGQETDRIEGGWQSAIIKNVDFKRLTEGKGFDAGQLILNFAKINVFRDKSSELPRPVDRFPKLPRQSLQALPFYLDLDTVILQGGYVSYAEHALEGDTMGSISLGNLDATIRHLTNDSVKIAQGASLTINTGTKIMGAGRLNAFFDMPYNAKNGEFYFEGILDSMDLTSMNRILVPVAFLKIRDGRAKKITFKVQGNDEYASGVMRFYYKKLNVAVINKEKHKDSRLISFIANTFVVNRNNPKNLFFLKRGKIFFRRNPERSVFHYWANTILTGVKSSIGIGNKEKPDKEIKKAMLRNILERFKIEGLKERREKRQRRKELKEQLKIIREEEKNKSGG